jgi:hypothetical protein
MPRVHLPGREVKRVLRREGITRLIDFACALEPFTALG